MNDGVEDAAATIQDDVIAQHRFDVSTRPSSGVHDSSRILTVAELEGLFEASAPPPEKRESASRSPDQNKLVVGLVGYPNVGKSSTINALLGAKKVSVSSTPGKTKHFQTLHLSEQTVLCDCPGLVFPQFATTAAELVVDGVLPIDQLREYSGPADLVAQRIPKDIIEATYGFQIASEEHEKCTGLEMLTSYAVARGFARQGQGNPDESRAARYVLKDYVNARLLFAHPPEGVDANEFNAPQRDRLRAALIKAHKMKQKQDPEDSAAAGPPATRSAREFDSAYFATTNSQPRVMGRKGVPGSSALQGRVKEDGTPILAGASITERPSTKKHFKPKKGKAKSGATPYE